MFYSSSFASGFNRNRRRDRPTSFQSCQSAGSYLLVVQGLEARGVGLAAVASRPPVSRRWHPPEAPRLPTLAAWANEPGAGGGGAAPFSETDICATPLTSEVGGGGPLGGGGGPDGGIGTLRSLSEAAPPAATAMTGVPGGGGGPGGNGGAPGPPDPATAEAPAATAAAVGFSPDMDPEPTLGMEAALESLPFPEDTGGLPC